MQANLIFHFPLNWWPRPSPSCTSAAPAATKMLPNDGSHWVFVEDHKMLRQGRSLAMAIRAGARMEELCGEIPARQDSPAALGWKAGPTLGGAHVPDHPGQPPAASGGCWGRRDEAGRRETPHQKLCAGCTALWKLFSMNLEFSF